MFGLSTGANTQTLVNQQNGDEDCVGSIEKLAPGSFSGVLRFDVGSKIISVQSSEISPVGQGRAEWYIEFVQYIDIFFISDTVWGNTVYIDIQ